MLHRANLLLEKEKLLLEIEALRRNQRQTPETVESAIMNASWLRGNKMMTTQSLSQIV